MDENKQLLNMEEQEPGTPTGGEKSLDEQIKDIFNDYLSRPASDADNEDAEEDSDDFWDESEDEGLESDSEPITNPDQSDVGEGEDVPTPSGEIPAETPTTKTFSQDEVNKLVGEARKAGRESGRKEILESLKTNYGLESLDGLGDVYGKSQQFDFLNGEYQNAMSELERYKTDDLLRNANIDPKKREDVQFYFKGKGIPLDEAGLKAELENHKDWLINAEPEVKGDTAVNVITKLNSDIKNQDASSNIVKETIGDPYSKPAPEGNSERDKMKEMYYGNGGF